MSRALNIDFALATAPQVYEWLRDTILSNELPPGAWLSEPEIRPQRGTCVSWFSTSAALSARLICEAVESDLARLADGDNAALTGSVPALALSALRGNSAFTETVQAILTRIRRDGVRPVLKAEPTA